MKYIFVLAFLLGCYLTLHLVVANKVSILSLADDDFNQTWNKFKSRHNKSYKNSSQELFRRKIFNETLKQINDHNQKYNNGELTYTLGVNEFSDWTSEEFMSYVNRGLKSNNPLKSSGNNNGNVVKSTGRATIPASFDWRTNFSIPIRDQGQCGSCWAFSTVFEVESFNILLNGQSTDLSEQNLVDCTYSTDGCNGGWMPDAYNYIIKNNGIDTEAGYAYSSYSSGVWSGSCKFKSSYVGAQLTSYVSLPSGNETALVEALYNVGPVAVAIYASSAFQSYSSGIFTDTTCSGKGINHAVNLVGYGTNSTTGQDYYILRNQWGTSWGENGYMLFARNNNNQCNIASYASYPIIKTNAPTTPKPTTTTTPKPTTTTTPKPTTTTLKPTTTTKTTTSTTKRPTTTTTSTQKPTTTTKSTTKKFFKFF